MTYLTAFATVLTLSLLVACGGGAGPSGASKPSAGAPAPGGGVPGVGAPAGAAAPAALSAAIAAAANEGVFQFYAPPSIDREGIDRLMAAFNRAHGLNLEYHYTRSTSMTRDSARAITEINAGRPPTWNVMLVTDAIIPRCSPTTCWRRWTGPRSA